MQANGLQLRETIRAAMLHASGEWGYPEVTVQRVLDRYGGNRAQLYRQFPNLAACYLEAYEIEIERLCAKLLRAGASAPDWRTGLGAALTALATFANERPLVARALLVEVHLAGEAALRKRREILERLARALDSARRESRSRHSPPPLTGLFMVSAIESAAATALSGGEPGRFEAVVPELTEIVCAAYFGDQPASPD
jgi:AcrR family transcriptional regulator